MKGFPKLHGAHASPDALSLETRGYLDELIRSRAREAPGFVLAGARRRGSGRALLGVLLLVGAVVLTLPLTGSSHGPAFDLFRAALAAAGAYLLGNEVRRRRGTALPGALRYVDAYYAWDVGPHEVEATVVLGAHDVRLEQAQTGSAPQVSLVAGGHRSRIRVKDVEEGKDLAAFLDAMTDVAKRFAPRDVEFAVQQPNRVAALAWRALGDDRFVEGGEALGAPPPVVRLRRGEGTSGHGAMPWVVAVAAGLLAFVGLGLVAGRLTEGRFYADVESAPAGDDSAALRYLETFPDGRHRDDVVGRLLDEVRRGPPTDVEAVDAFLARYPDGRQAAAARALREDRMCALAKRGAPDNLDGVHAYLRVYPEGRYVADMEALKEQHLYERAVDAPKEDMKSIETYLDRYPEGRYRDDALRLQEDRYFQLAEESGETDLTWVGVYLSRYPKGRFAEKAQRLKDHRYFALAMAAGKDDVKALDHYIESFPDGQHRKAALELRDDRRFHAARRASEVDTDPGPLRRYLANPENRRNREDAQRAIDLLYDTALARFRRSARGGRSDKDLVRGFTLVLERLKTAPTSRVAVGFRSTKDLEPTTAQLAEERRVAKAIEAVQVMPYGDCFAPAQVRARNDDILSLMNVATAKAVGAALLKLEAAEAGETPQILVRHHVRLTGEAHPVATRDMDGSIKYTEVARGFALDWKLEITSAPGERTVRYAVSTRPKKGLTVRMGDKAPDWAFYGAQVETALMGFAAAMIRACGLPAPPLPDNVIFSE